MITLDQNNQPTSIHEYGEYEKYTTNNRMELSAIIGILFKIYTDKKINTHDIGTHETNSEKQLLKKIDIYTDSSYSIQGITSWIHDWKKNGWKTSTKKPVLNDDLWRKLDEYVNLLKENGCMINFHHVRGHAGIAGNERCDSIATTCADTQTSFSRIYTTDDIERVIENYIPMIHYAQKKQS
jgi:ribonuclease HI